LLDDGVRASFEWKETRIPRENPQDRAVNDLTFLYTTPED